MRMPFFLEIPGVLLFWGKTNNDHSIHLVHDVLFAVGTRCRFLKDIINHGG
jgi:hypothetical protein